MPSIWTHDDPSGQPLVRRWVFWQVTSQRIITSIRRMEANSRLPRDASLLNDGQLPKKVELMRS